jgi:hypothetical protein
MQPSAGYMHSGYPIVTHLDCCKPDNKECIFNFEKLKRFGNWGLFHELGHNMQRDEWTFDGSVEVTVNIFSMHAFEFVVEKPILRQRWPLGQVQELRRHFKDGKIPTYKEWSNNPGFALMVFLQLIKHFDWASMRKFMSDYEQDIKEKRNLPKTNQDKIDQFVIRYSKIVGKNIRPQFEMHGLPVSPSVDEQIGSDLEPWCPVEEKDASRLFNLD